MSDPTIFRFFRITAWRLTPMVPHQQQSHSPDLDTRQRAFRKYRCQPGRIFQAHRVTGIRDHIDRYPIRGQNVLVGIGKAVLPKDSTIFVPDDAGSESANPDCCLRREIWLRYRPHLRTPPAWWPPSLYRPPPLLGDDVAAGRTGCAEDEDLRCSGVLRFRGEGIHDLNPLKDGRLREG